MNNPTQGQEQEGSTAMFTSGCEQEWRAGLGAPYSTGMMYRPFCEKRLMWTGTVRAEST